jgi:hypothetical protein
MSWFDLVGGKITGFDYNLWASAKLNKAETLATLKYTLDLRLQNGNRAPFMFGAHTDYFGSKNAALFGQISVRERQEVMEQFIAYAQSKPEVRIVPFNSIVNWMRNPSAIDCSYNCPAPSLPPEVTNPGNQLNKVDDAVELAIQATDPNGFSLTITAENLPAGLSIIPETGLISGIVTTESIKTVTINVNNGEQTSTITFNWKIEVDTQVVDPWDIIDAIGGRINDLQEHNDFLSAKYFKGKKINQKRENQHFISSNLYRAAIAAWNGRPRDAISRLKYVSSKLKKKMNKGSEKKRLTRNIKREIDNLKALLNVRF